MKVYAKTPVLLEETEIDRVFDARLDFLIAGHSVNERGEVINEAGCWVGMADDPIFAIPVAAFVLKEAIRRDRVERRAKERRAS